MADINAPQLHRQLIEELKATKGYDRMLDAKVHTAIYHDVDPEDPSNNTYPRIISRRDNEEWHREHGYYYVRAFSGISMEEAPHYSSDKTLKRMAIFVLSNMQEYLNGSV